MMNTTNNNNNNPQQSSHEILLPPSTSTTLLPSLPRSSIIDYRVRCRTSGINIDPNKLTTIKRSQAISNIQDLDEDSPVTFEIEPNEHHHGRKRAQLLSFSIGDRTTNESIISIDEKIKTSNNAEDDKFNTQLENSEPLPDYIEDERPILPGIRVKGATLNRLIRILIDCFNVDGTIINGNEYPKIFFLMHKWIIESEHLSNMLYDLYKHHDDDYNKTANEKQQCKEYQLRICQAYNYWIKNFPMHFDLDKNLKEACERMQKLIEFSGDVEFMNLIDPSQIPSFDWMRQRTIRNQMKNKIVSLGFNKIESQTLAAQLTYLEWKILRRITFTDYKTYAIKNTLRDSPRLERSIQFFNGLSTWIQCMVLSKMTPKQRAEIIHKFLEVAKYLRDLQNFNTCLAVIGGISHSALARLSKTTTCLSTEDIKLLSEMTDLLSSNSNYAQYRKNLSESEGFKIPIIGVHLKDIISLHVALHDHLEYDLINFRKLVQLSIIFQTLYNIQLSVPPVQPNHDLINLLTLSVDLSYTEDEIYELSLAREPRLSVSSSDQTSRSLSSNETTSEPTSDGYKKKGQIHSPVFADWAAGVSQTIDIQTIQRHVNAMVEAVFTTYDHDRDGYISHTEFEEIAQNFPFIDTFTVLDSDQDGMISKTEMRSYFLRAKYHDLKGEFKHDFHETTYFKPTFCAHCTGLLWGLIKQGWKCKDCNINAHRHCKDQVVMECRQKRQHSVNKQSSVSDTRTRRSPFHIRKTRKQQATQTDDTNFTSSSSSTSSLSSSLSSSSSAASSESCTSSSDNEQQSQQIADKTTQHHYFNLRKPSSIKVRKQILSDSNDDYYYTHSLSSQQVDSLTTVNSVISTNINPVQQLIPRGPLICSDSFEKWNDRCFAKNRPLSTSTLLSPVSTTETTSEIIIDKQDKDDETIRQSLHVNDLYLESNVSDDDSCFTPNTNKKTLQLSKITANYNSNQDLNRKQFPFNEVLQTLPTKTESSQYEIFERLRQAEEEKKRLKVENRAMKQELVRTKSKISSLKREMNSIQQQKLQPHNQLFSSTVMSTHKKSYHDLHSTNQQLLSPTFSCTKENFLPENQINMKNLSISTDNEVLSSSPVIVTNRSSSTQTSPFDKLLTSNEDQTRRLSSLTSSSKSTDSFAPLPDEQLRLYLTETLQREKDSTV